EQFGRSSKDSIDTSKDLYQLTDEDLKYLFDKDSGGNPNYVNANGSPATLSAQERTDALDIGVKRKKEIFRDAAGSRYDPNDEGPGGLPFEGGYYMQGSKRYVKVKALADDGRTYTERYYAVIDDFDGSGNPTSRPGTDTYDMGDILK